MGTGIIFLLLLLATFKKGDFLKLFMVELKDKGYKLDSDNLVRLLSEVQHEWDPFGDVAFSGRFLALEMEKRLTDGSFDNGLFGDLLKNLHNEIYGLKIVDKNKDKFFLVHGEHEGPWYRLRHCAYCK